MTENSKVLVALIAGLAAGAALGLLLAPENGKETRDKLSSALKNLKDKALDQAYEEIDKLASMKNEVIERTKDTVASAEDEIKAEISDKIQEA